jgi:hypothetical protein
MAGVSTTLRLRTPCHVVRHGHGVPAPGIGRDALKHNLADEKDRYSEARAQVSLLEGEIATIHRIHEGARAVMCAGGINGHDFVKKILFVLARISQRIFSVDRREAAQRKRICYYVVASTAMS